MRDNYLEFLDEDVDLLSYYNKNGGLDSDPKKNTADSIARWRFIFPNESINKQIHVYTYCVPNIIIDGGGKDDIDLLEKIQQDLKMLSYVRWL